MYKYIKITKRFNVYLHVSLGDENSFGLRALAEAVLRSVMLNHEHLEYYPSIYELTDHFFIGATLQSMISLIF